MTKVECYTIRMISIREYTENDRPELIHMITLLHDYERSLDPKKVPGSQMAHEYFDFLIKQMTNNQGKIYIAQFNETAVGFIACWIEHDEVVLDINPQYGFISDIFVSENDRGKGIGKELIQKVAEYMKQNTITQLRVHALFNNTPANSFYQRNGFSSYEIVYHKQI